MAPFMLLQQPLLVRATIRDADWRMALMGIIIIVVSGFYYRCYFGSGRCVSFFTMCGFDAC